MVQLFSLPAFVLLASIALIADARGSEAIADFEPNNSIDAAESIEFDREVDGNLSSMSDVDYYKFSVDQRVKLSIAFSSEKSIRHRLEL